MGGPVTFGHQSEMDNGTELLKDIPEFIFRIFVY